MTKKTFFGRELELKLLNSSAQTSSSEFIYVRGRRRVGKSWLLKYFKTQSKFPCFYISGIKDESSAAFLSRFAHEWDNFAGTPTLSKIKIDFLKLKEIFFAITTYAQSSDKPIILIFDEIQWLAKKGLGLVGSIKEAWLDWEMSSKVKVIICGSSNKFFQTYTGGEEKILRGLRTKASIWVQPFSLHDVGKYFLKGWKQNEVAFTYLLLGGVPYYLKQLNPSLGPINALNEVLFTKRSIFLEEINELLQIEFNQAGIEQAKTVLSCLGTNGTTQKKIVDLLGIPFSSLSDLLIRLIDYKIIHRKLPFGQSPAKNKAGYVYYSRDFYLNCYFSLLAPLEKVIKNNDKGLLFSRYCLHSKNGYYINNYTGKMFEYLLWNYLDEQASQAEMLLNKLNLAQRNYSIGTYWDKETEIDLVIESEDDRTTRLIECKWINSSNSLSEKDILSITNKNYPVRKGYTINRYLLTAYPLSKTLTNIAKEHLLEILNLSDFF